MPDKVCQSADGVDGAQAAEHDTAMRMPAALILLAATLAACSSEGGDTTTGLDPEPHSRGLGEPCKRGHVIDWSESTEPCKEGLLCIAFNECDVGYCMPRCDTSEGCPNIDGLQSYCGIWHSGMPRACSFDCTAAEAECPTSYAVALECGLPTPGACMPHQEECAAP